jgi:hypothetical protein
MSTAGKVLVVLVMLVAAVWIVLASAVTEWNKSGTEQVAKLKEQVEGNERQLAEVTRKVALLKADIALEQRAMAEQLAVTRALQADLQKARSETIEIASRVKLQVASSQETARQAAATKDYRIKEKTQENEARLAAEGEVERLKQEHARLVDQLNQLQDKFKATVESNRKLLGRLKATRAS